MQNSIKYIKTSLEIAILILGIVYIVSYAAPRSYILGALKSRIINFTQNVDVQNGDFIFQHLPAPLTEMIANITESQYSHCGIIVKKANGFFVLEAIGPVKETPLNEWISRGISQKFTIVRLKRPYRHEIPAIIQAGYTFIGRPYDIQYQWDDKNIYCSELIYKAVYNAAGIKLAEFEKLGDMKWQHYEKQIRQLTSGNLPLEREMITPQALVVSDMVELVYKEK